MEVEDVEFWEIVPGFEHSLVVGVITTHPVKILGMGVGPCVGLNKIGKTTVLGVAATMDDLGVWENATDHGDIENIERLFVCDEAFFGDFVVHLGGVF